MSAETQFQAAGSRMKHNNSWTITSGQFLVLIWLRRGKRERETSSQNTGKVDKNDDQEQVNTKATSEGIRDRKERKRFEGTCNRGRNGKRG